MFEDERGPITRFEWGRFEIDGEVHSEDGEGVGKDVFVFGNRVLPWSARKGHRLTPEMVDCVLKEKIDVLVIGNGVNGAIKVTKKTRKAVRKAGIAELIIEATPDACATYNRLVYEGRQVALLAHGTC